MPEWTLVAVVGAGGGVGCELEDDEYVVERGSVVLALASTRLVMRTVVPSKCQSPMNRPWG
jgi:hypothetical protein